MIDKKGKFFGIVNLFDALVIVVFVTVIFVGFKWLSDKQEVASKDVYFTVEVKNVSEDFGNNYPIGEDVRDAVNDSYYGVVDKVEMVPVKVVGIDKVKGVFINTVVEGLFDAHITVKCKGEQGEFETYANGSPVRIGKQTFIKGKGFAGEGFIIGLKVE